MNILNAINIMQVNQVYYVIDIKVSGFEKYTGNILHGVSSGQGTGIMNNGVMFTGTFKNGRLNGHGKITDGNNIWIGEFENDKLHGRGKRIIGNQVEDGMFRYGLLHGKGKHTNVDNVSKGTFENGKLHGYGETIENGKIFKGIFYYGILHGQGKYIYGNTVDEGMFSFGDLNGIGRREIKNDVENHPSKIWEGEFQKNILHGCGKHTYGNIIDEGMFSFGELNGIGKRVNSNTNEIWVGKFKNNMLHGQGKYTNGRRTELGMYSLGKLHGHGRIIIDKLILSEGIFVNGEISHVRNVASPCISVAADIAGSFEKINTKSAFAPYVRSSSTDNRPASSPVINNTVAKRKTPSNIEDGGEVFDSENFQPLKKVKIEDSV